MSEHPGAEITSGNHDSLFCHDLPTSPQPGLGRILVTGASGYIGGRLVPELLARGYRVRAMVRGGAEVYRQKWPGARVVVADALDKNSLKDALRGVYAAYYLIHSLLLGPWQFEKADIQAAINFREAAEEQGVERILYLGGLGDLHTARSRHLQSRTLVADELQAGKVPVTCLRAAVIIGSGSASYEIISHMVSNMPFILIPHWARNRCQPIGIRDVIKYLVGALETPGTAGRSFDIGGSETLTYEQMLKTFARITKRRRLFVPSPFSHIGLYSYFASLLTPVPAPIISCLMEGLKDEVVCRNEDIRKYINFKTLTYREAVVRALSREEQDNIHTRWSDAYPPAHELAMKLRELEGKPTYTASFSLLSDKPAAALFRSVCAVGGKTGWFNNNWIWRLRGSIDRLLIGVGSVRGRRSHSTLEINDVVDFWRVEDLKPDRRLLLRAEMKLPGKAWLEFNIGEENGQRRLSTTAYFHTRGILGKAYWYIFLPFHRFIFTDLIKQIENRS